ncbi:hypothetical protein ZWY2020_035690 [Hordeum vulgare]|nr:hypothetical protein ZWY2020_035690 [Hordeum vulgare]
MLVGTGETTTSPGLGAVHRGRWLSPLAGFVRPSQLAGAIRRRSSPSMWGRRHFRFSSFSYRIAPCVRRLTTLSLLIISIFSLRHNPPPPPRPTLPLIPTPRLRGLPIEALIAGIRAAPRSSELYFRARKAGSFGVNSLWVDCVREKGRAERLPELRLWLSENDGIGQVPRDH